MDLQTHIDMLKTAELQFRLASAVRLATTDGRQPLELPVMWVHGQHQVSFDEIALSSKQADFAAFFLERTATYLMAVQIQEALTWHTSGQARSHSNADIRAAFEISRLVRNSFTHQPLHPTWSIDPFCTDKEFVVPEITKPEIIKLDTTNLQGKEFDWQDYGGPLALLRLSQYVRREILGDVDKGVC